MWTTVSLGDVAFASKEKVEPNSGQVNRYVAGEHMDTDDLRVHRWGRVGDGYLGPAFHRRFRPGQVLYGSRRTYLRKVAVADFEGVTSNTTFVVDTASSAVMLSEFLPIVMTSEAFHSHAIHESKGSVNPYVNWTDIASFEFNLPPIDVQEKLSSLFWAVERDRIASMSLTKAADRAIRLYAAQLFGESRDDRMSIGEILDLSQYGSSVRASESGDVPIIRMSNLENGSVTAHGLKYCDLPDSDLATYRLRSGDVLFNRTNSVELVGRSGLFDLPGDFVFASYLVRLRPDPLIMTPEYLNEFINSTPGQLKIRAHLSKGVSQANISPAKLRKVIIPVPALDQQRKVVDALARLRVRRDSVACRVASAMSLRSALVAEAFEARA